MIVTQIRGGLGNQFFQYAAGRALAHRLGTSLKLDVSFYKRNNYRIWDLQYFRIAAESVTPVYDRLFRFVPGRFQRQEILKPLGRLFGEIAVYDPTDDTGAGLPAGMNVLYDRQEGFDERFLTVTGDVYLHGYWQTERYFAPIAGVIRDELQLRDPPDAENAALLEQIRATEAVAVHVRRGDSLSSPVFSVCGPDYYERAAATLRTQVREPHFYVFSDDPVWTRSHIRPGAPCTYVTYNTGRRDVEDLRLMSACQHFIIANSTFSWWGAWLCTNPAKQVICPRRWYLDPARPIRDLLPEGWRQV